MINLHKFDPYSKWGVGNGKEGGRTRRQGDKETGRKGKGKSLSPCLLVPLSPALPLPRSPALPLPFSPSCPSCFLLHKLYLVINKTASGNRISNATTRLSYEEQETLSGGRNCFRRVDGRVEAMGAIIFRRD